MERLQKDEHEYLTDEMIMLLAQNQVTTLLEFLQQDTDRLSVIMDLTLTQVLSVRDAVLKKFSAPLVTGKSLYVRNLNSKKFIKSGIASLDYATEGGLPIGYITEICGINQSGKTQLCLQLAINYIRNNNESVLYVDTKGDFSASMINRMLLAGGCSTKEVDSVLSKINVSYIRSMDDMLELIQEMKDKELELCRLRLVIFDCMPCVTSPHLGSRCHAAQRFLNLFVDNTKYICKEMGASIVCVNVQTRWVEQGTNEGEGDQDNTVREIRKRSLGRYWQDIPTFILYLEKVEPNYHGITKLNATLTKYSDPTNLKQFSLTISNQGVS